VWHIAMAWAVVWVLLRTVVYLAFHVYAAHGLIGIDRGIVPDGEQSVEDDPGEDTHRSQRDH
jgi:hypothetical protein